MSETTATTPPVEAKPKKKRTILKWTIRIVLGVVLLLIVAVLVALAKLPGIVKAQVEARGTAALGLPVTVDDVDIRLLAGGADLNGFTIGAPAGFKTTKLFEFKNAGAAVSLHSLLTDTIVVEEVHLKDATLNLEVGKDGRQLLKAVQESIAKAAEDAAKTEDKEPKEKNPKDESAPSKGFRIDEIVVENLTMNMHDEYADETPADSSLAIGALSISNIYMPPSNVKPTAQMMKVSVKSYALTADKKFPNPSFFTYDQLDIDYDLGTLLATMDGQRHVIIPKLSVKNPHFTAEWLQKKKDDDSFPENLNQFVLTAMNCAGSENPQKAGANAKKIQDKQASAAKAEEKVTATVDATDEPAPNESPKESVAAPKEPVPEALPTIVELGELDVTGLELAYLLHKEKSEMRIVNGEIKMTNIVYPYREGTDTTLIFSAEPLDKESKLTLKAHGALTQTELKDDVEVVMEMSNQRLGGLGEVSDGRLDSTLNMTVSKGYADGDISAKVKGLAFKGNDLKYKLTAFGANTVGGSSRSFKFRVPLEDASWEQILNTIRAQLIDALRQAAGIPVEMMGAIFGDDVGAVFGSVSGALGETAKSLGGTVGKAGEAVLKNPVGAATKTAGDAAGTASKTAEGAVKEAGGAAKDAGNVIKGIFGGKKEQDKKKKAEN
ncbi:hypothetical protein BH09SUM1_BH09SUM1_26650 [soil metagenome]